MYSEFKGAYGYSIMIQSSDKKYICHYAHVDPEYMLPKGTKVSKGDIVAKVGPKYIHFGPIRDYTGRYTNRIYNRTTFTFWTYARWKVCRPKRSNRGC